MATLMDEYNRHSFSVALSHAAPAMATAPASPTTQTPSSLLASVSPWERMFRGLTLQRQQELLTQAVAAVGDSKFHGLRKDPLLAELHRGLAGELPTSASAKFFIMQEAVGREEFAFRYGNWEYPKLGTGKTRCTTLKRDGGIAIESAPSTGCVRIENPWHPLRGRGAYKKPELASMVEALGGAPLPGAKADALYAMLVGKLEPLGQP